MVIATKVHVTSHLVLYGRQGANIEADTKYLLWITRPARCSLSKREGGLSRDSVNTQ